MSLYIGMESGDLSEWNNGVKGTVTVVTSPVHHGNYALMAGANIEDYVEYVPLSPIPDEYVQAQVQFPALPQAGYGAMFLRIAASDWLTFVAGGIYRSPDGTMNWALGSEGGAWQLAASASINVNQWYTIKIRRKKASAIGAMDGIATMWVDGVQVLTTTVASELDSQAFNGGNVYTDNPSGFISYQDCFYMSDVDIPLEGQSILTFTLTKTHDFVPWSAPFNGRLTDGQGIGIQNATIQIWSFYEAINDFVYSGISALTDGNGNYSGEFPFTVEFWTPGMTGRLRAQYGATISAEVQVQMDAEYGSLLITATAGAMAVNASVTANGQSGVTPCAFQLPIGTYSVIGTFGNETLPAQTATLIAGQTTAIALSFTPTPLVPMPFGDKFVQISPSWMVVNGTWRAIIPPPS